MADKTAAWEDVRRAERAYEKHGGRITPEDVDEAYALSPSGQ